MKNLLLIAFAYSFIGCNNLSGTSTTFDTSAEMLTDTSALAPVDYTTAGPVYDWSYSNDVDKMDGDTSYFAAVTSNNQLYFKFPYDGGASGELTVRKMNGRNEVLFSISKGQILDNISDNRVIRLKFDDEKPITVGYSGTSDYRSDMMFIGSPSLIVSKLKKAKKLLLEAEFYEAGRQQLEFTVDGFDWHH